MNYHFEKYFRQLIFRMFLIRDGYKDVTKYRDSFLKYSFNTNHQINAKIYNGLYNIINHAINTTNYYRELSLENDIQIKNKEAILDKLLEFPVLTKEQIQENKNNMISSEFHFGKLDKSYTGGTSGNPTSFYRDQKCTAMRIGRQLGILEKCGYSLGDRCGLIWGAHEDLDDMSSNFNLKKRLRKFSTGKEILCCDIMSSHKMMKYYNKLISYCPSVLYGYPNALNEFANFINNKKLRPIKVNLIFCTAERLTEENRKMLSHIFMGEVYNLYCTREHGCIGFECKERNGMHLDLGSVYLEILNNGIPAKRGEIGDIVVTDLLNYGMPFIRYKIGDRGRLALKKCGCGCNLPLLAKLEGRVSDMLYRSDGSSVAGIMLIDLFLDKPEIKNMQIIQKNVREMDIKLVIGKHYTEKFQNKVKSEICKYMNQDILINIEIVQDIPKNPISGKVSEVISEIKL